MSEQEAVMEIEPGEGEARSRQGQGGGPKTSFGKEASCQNATTHNLTSSVVTNLPTYFEADVAERIAAYAEEFLPVTDSDWSLIRLAALAFVQHQEALNEQMYYLADRSCRARTYWKQHRLDDVAKTSNRLADRPAERVAALMLSVDGARRLLDQWKMLGKALESWGTWQEGLQRLAFDLLGVDEIARPFDTNGVADGSKEVRQALVDRQCRELEALITGDYAQEDARLRDGALKGKGYLNEPGFRRLVAYERRALRMNHDCLAALDRRKAEREAADRDAEAAEPTPSPAQPVAIDAGDRARQGAEDPRAMARNKQQLRAERRAKKAGKRRNR